MFSEDCKNYESILNASLDLFFQNYNEFMKLKPSSDDNKIRIAKKNKMH